MRQMLNNLGLTLQNRLTILGVAVSLLIPFAFRTEYIRHLLNLMGIFALLAISLNIVVGLAGQVSMGHAGFYAVGAYTTALLALRLHAPAWVGLVCAVCVSCLAGAILGIPTLRLRGIYLVMATWGFGEIVRLVLINLEGFTGGPNGLRGIPPARIFGITFSSSVSMYYLIILSLFLVVAVVRRVIDSRIGDAFIAIREDELAASVAGINPARFKVLAFVLSAGVAGLAGGLYTLLTRFISPDCFTFNESVLILSMAVVGGLGNIEGGILGAILLVFVSEFLRVLGPWRNVLYGVIVVLVLIFFEGGLAPAISRVLRKYTSKIVLHSNLESKPVQGGSIHGNP